MGQSGKGHTDEIEIIDLESPASICPNLPKYPMQIVGSVGGLYFQEQPYICGGFVKEEVNDCNYFENGEWKPAHSLSTARFYPAISASPYPRETNKLFVTGGFNWSTEFFQTTGVNFINIMRTNFSYEHCSGSFFYMHVTREKLPKQLLYENRARVKLMKLMAELLGESGWQEKLPNLPVPLNAHCMVLLNDTTVMVIGGRLNATFTYVSTIWNSRHNSC